MNVYDRFQLKLIEKDIMNLISGHKLVVHTYPNHLERKSVMLEYDPVNTTIIIVDGVVALSAEIIRQTANFKVFTTAEPQEFRKRINEYYHWRNKTSREIEELLEKRELDEYQLIEKESKFADLIINSSFS